jgi:hypothetical protein
MTTHRADRTLRCATGLIIGVLMATAGSAAPAAAADPVPDDSYACWADLGTGLSLCVAQGVDLVAAVADEYGVYLTVPAGAIPDSAGSAGPTQLFESRSADARATTAAVISVIYDNASYGGASYSLSSAGGCGYGYASLVPLGWNDRASSYRSFAGCSTALFANTNYTGTSTGYAANAASLGGMNNQGSSWSVQ